MNNTSISGYIQDGQGRLIPVDRVKDIDKLRDDTVQELIQRVLTMQDTLSRFKKQLKDDLASYFALSYEKYGKKYGGKKGNVILTSYDGSLRIHVHMSRVIYFDERLQVAKELIDECITRWAQGSSSEIQALVNDAFQVDREGEVNTARILSLRRFEIRDPQWQKAMEAISDSIQVAGTKEHIRFYRRDDAGKYQPISLDFTVI